MKKLMFDMVLNNQVILTNLGKVLIVDENPIEAELKRRWLLRGDEKVVVSVEEHQFNAIITLGCPNHGYNYVLVGFGVLEPDTARRLLQKKLDFFA